MAKSLSSLLARLQTKQREEEEQEKLKRAEKEEEGCKENGDKGIAL